jgi:hypothetical protein
MNVCFHKHGEQSEMSPSRRTSIIAGRKSRHSDWIIIRVANNTDSETYYMAGVWCVAQYFAKRIRGYGNALATYDVIRKELGFVYEIRPID